MTDSQDGHQRPIAVIIGAGFGGLGMAIELKRAASTTSSILEKADAVGGTWRDNTYPGAACDVPSHLYSYSFEPKPRLVAQVRGRRRDPRVPRALRAQVRGIGGTCASASRSRREFDEAHRSLDDRARPSGEDVADAHSGVPRAASSEPARLSEHAGPRTFAGTAFHSARWDHDFDLAGKRVAVIGTGASAIQFVPQIEPQVRR